MNFLSNKINVKHFVLFLIPLLFLSLINCSEKKDKADLILFNGNVITVDSSNTIVQAISIKSDRIKALGSNEEILKYKGDSTIVIDLKGRSAIPGFIDSHAHLISTGKARINLNLREARNWDEVIYLVALAADNARKGEWIIGRGWHQEKWNPTPMENVNGYPFHTKLSNATPDNPVMLLHASGHAIFVNKTAMELSGITTETPNPSGGEILRDEEGGAVGVFMEEAERLISTHYQNYLESRSYQDQINDKKKAITLAIEECLSNGITTLHDAGASFEDLRVIKEMVDDNQIKIRLYEMISENYQLLKDSLRQYQTIGYGNNRLSVQSIKLFIDGALGSRGAWLLNPYKDSPLQTGLNVTPISEIKNIANLAAENDFQICTHAIGDKGNRIILDIYESIFEQYPNRNDLRWRVEHAQHLSKKDIPRFAELGVIASMQSIHCTSDAPYVEKRLGSERAKTGAYAWSSLIESGAYICNGTDSPVEPISPIENFYAAVTRKTSDGNTFYADQIMTRIEALQSYTINGAYAAFEENIKGSLEVGKLADITVLSKDILKIADEDILNTEIIYTIVGGKILYENK